MQTRSKQYRVLVFDVETTGLLPKIGLNGESPTINMYPYILQLSFILFNTVTGIIERKFDTYINVSKDIIIPEEITVLTGATRELCDTGMSMVSAIEHLYDAYMKSDTIVAHNYSFDSQMIKIELQRNSDAIFISAPYCINIFNLIYEDLFSITSYCTMKHGIYLCNIMVTPENGRKPYKKWPKLTELYEGLFNSRPANLHNSMIDVMVCLRCYLKMTNKYEFSNAAFNQLLDNAFSK